MKKFKIEWVYKWSMYVDKAYEKKKNWAKA